MGLALDQDAGGPRGRERVHARDLLHVPVPPEPVADLEARLLVQAPPRCRVAARVGRAVGGDPRTGVPRDDVMAVDARGGGAHGGAGRAGVVRGRRWHGHEHGGDDQERDGQTARGGPHSAGRGDAHGDPLTSYSLPRRGDSLGRRVGSEHPVCGTYEAPVRPTMCITTPIDTGCRMWREAAPWHSRPDATGGNRTDVLRSRQSAAHRADRGRGARLGAGGRSTAADGNRLAAFRARAAEPTGAGIVILPDVRGLHPYYEELALRFAERGIDALAIDYFGRTAGAATAATRRSTTCRMSRRRRGPASRADIAAGVAAIRAADGERPGAAAALHDRVLHGRADVVPGRDPRPRPGGRHRVLRHGRRARGATMPRPRSTSPATSARRSSALFGGADAGIPPDASRPSSAALTAAGVDHRARHVPRRAAQLLRPQGDRVRRRERGRLGEGAGVRRFEDRGGRPDRQDRLTTFAPVLRGSTTSIAPGQVGVGRGGGEGRLRPG